jgi:type I restriction enzyme M protein
MRSCGANQGQSFYNASPLDLKKLTGDQDNIGQNLRAYIQGFSPEVRDIFERFEFDTQIDRLSKAGLLYQVTEKFTQIDLHPDKVTNHQMGLVFEELIRRFAELSNETAGEHFTPREVIRLMVDLIFAEDGMDLSKPSVVRTIYDPTAGTGGMLSVAEEYLTNLNPTAQVSLFGQELNPESYAICKADMLIKGQDVGNIAFGNTLSDDGHPDQKFDYMLSNPPFGVEWKKVEKQVRAEHEQKGHAGRFGPGLPRVSDGSLLFLMHLLSKMRPAAQGGARFGIVLNGSPLFTGGGRIGRKRDSPPCSGNRSGRGHRGPADRYVLQHRHCHLCLGADQPQTRPPQGPRATDRRVGILAKDAQKPWVQA